MLKKLHECAGEGIAGRSITGQNRTGQSTAGQDAALALSQVDILAPFTYGLEYSAPARALYCSVRAVRSIDARARVWRRLRHSR